MSELKACCTTWEAVHPELATKQLQEINSSNLPGYLVAPVVRVLNLMGNYCPVCGTPLVEGLKAPVQQPSKKVRQEEAEAAEPAPLKRIPCPKELTQGNIILRGCGGAGITGTDEFGIESKCTVCMGKGYIEIKRNFAEVENKNAVLRDRLATSKQVPVNDQTT